MKLNFEENKQIYKGFIVSHVLGSPMTSVFMILSGFFILDQEPDVYKTTKRIIRCCVLFIEAKLVYQFIGIYYEWIQPFDSFFSIDEVKYLLEYDINPPSLPDYT